MARLKVATAIFALLHCTFAAPAPASPPSDFPGSETPYKVVPTGTDIPQPTDGADPNNAVGTYLYGYIGCKDVFGSGAKGKIDDAYYDAWLISNTNEVHSNIDWNHAAALEFLGAPGLNKEQQPQIQAVFKNTATMIYSYKNPFQHYIKVRCDDPRKRCQKKPTKDPPCKPGPAGSATAPKKPDSTPLAYSLNNDPDSTGTPMINFCPGFFERRKLSDAINYGKALVSPNNLKLSNYDSRAITFLHELYHLDLAADSVDNSPNPRTDDYKVNIKLANGDLYPSMVYGPFVTKTMARYQAGGGFQSVGWFVQRNADNLAYYAMAKYVMTKNGAVYPHLPIVIREIDGVPWVPKKSTDGLLAVFSGDESNFYLNSNADLSVWDYTPGDDYPGCPDNEDPRDPATTININGFAPFSAYPDSYNKQLQEWVKALDGSGGPGTGDPDSGGGGGQQIAIASYINPLGEPQTWDRLLAYDTGKLSVLVANVLNGPDYVVEPAWKSVIDRAAASGKKILGYVRTGYLGVSQHKFTTRLGSHELADWASQIEQDIDKWFELYGGSLGGIFFDEGWPECGPNNIYSDLYKYIDGYTKRKHPGAYTVLNPGSPIAQCYEDTMDTLLTFEQSYDDYKNTYVPNNWTATDPRKIWHIIYKVPQSEIANVAALSRSRNVGLIEITDDVWPNPYDNLPSDAYMKDVMNTVSGGKPPIKDAPKPGGSQVTGLPGNTAVAASDYSSVTLTWSAVGGAQGYAVYKNGAQVLELPASLTRATIGMLDPGSSGLSFEVRAIMASGGGGGSHVVSASTKPLPSSGTITNVGFTQNGASVTYTADVLVPYAFVRLFIGIKQPDPGIARGWPIQHPDPDPVQGFARHQIVNYLVEGNDFYSGFFKYSGAWYETSKENADWTWSTIGEAKQTQNGYTYTWNVPLGGAPDGVASEYLIQGQGYAPKTNVFKGTLRMYSTV